MIVWLVTQDEDHNCYNVLKATKKEALKEVKERKAYTRFDDMFKIELWTFLRNWFDIVEWCTSESGGRHASSLGTVLAKYDPYSGKRIYDD